MKKVKLKLVGLDGNAFSIMGAFQHQARKEGWTTTEIDEVLNEAMSSDYHHLLATISKHCSKHCVNPL
ncbi:MAG: hypothetical protein EBU08_18910 [Micrococcales bacterium]|nr:hypothetical protein [Micrococcales bacterium]